MIDTFPQYDNQYLYTLSSGIWLTDSRLIEIALIRVALPQFQLSTFEEISVDQYHTVCNL